MISNDVPLLSISVALSLTSEGVDSTIVQSQPCVMRAGCLRRKFVLDGLARDSLDSAIGKSLKSQPFRSQPVLSTDTVYSEHERLDLYV